MEQWKKRRWRWMQKMSRRRRGRHRHRSFSSTPTFCHLIHLFSITRCSLTATSIACCELWTSKNALMPRIHRYRLYLER